MQHYAILTLLASVAILSVESCTRTPPGTPPGQTFEGSKHGLELQVQRAKAAKKATLYLHETQSIPTGVPTFLDVLKNYTLIRAVIADSNTVRGDMFIQTYYKLSVLETLSKQPTIPTEKISPEILEQLPLRAESEIFLRKTGGELMMNGIRVIQACSEDDFALQPGKEYLIAMYLDGAAFGVSAGGAATI